MERGAIVFSIQDLEKLILNEVDFTQTMCENNKKIALKFILSILYIFIDFLCQWYVF